MASLLISSAVESMDVYAKLEYQTQRLTVLEQELERINGQLRYHQRYSEALEVDFEHVIGQLQQLQHVRPKIAEPMVC